MANNFKITDGNYYISKSGHDSNDGLTPDTPRRSSNGITGSKYVIGAGVYNMVFGSGQYIGDGHVKIVNQSFPASSATYISVENMNFENCIFGLISGNGRGAVARNCTYRNCSGDILSARFSTVNSTTLPASSYNVFINCFDNGSASTDTTSKGADQSIYIGCDMRVRYLRNSYIDNNSVIEILHPYLNVYSNVEGVLKITGSNFSDATVRSYAVQDTKVGTPQDNGFEPGIKWFTYDTLIADGFIGTTAGLADAINTLISKPPLFNNVAINDFTLQAGSPHIGAGFGGENIGGTKAAISIYNTSGGLSEITTSPEISTSNPNSYTVAPGFTEGYIDYIGKIGTSNLTLKEIDPISSLEFDSDIQGGQLGNRNVPDSEPLSVEYPRRLTTTSAAIDALTLNVTGHDAIVGEIVRVDGQDREVVAITTDTITVNTAFRAIVQTGIEFQIGQQIRIGALNPNRLTFMMRTSKEINKPTLDSQWDNDIDPLYGMTGSFLTQEWGEIPGYYIDSGTSEVWGSGDSERPPGLAKNEISCKWIHVRVYLRNNYES